MGIFDKLRGRQEETALDQRQAFAAVLLVTIAADGHVSDDEGRAFASIVNRMDLFKSQTGAEFSSMVDDLLGRLSRNGPEPLLASATPALPIELRETAFALAVDLVLADGHVEQSERRLLEDLYSGLGLSADFAANVIEIMSIKNRG